MNKHKEADYIHFGDLRLTERFEKILESFTEEPTSTIPQACKTLAKTKAVYRFFSNDRVEAKAIREGMHNAAIARMKEKRNSVFLFQSDATNIVFSSHKKLKGIGVLRNQNARGLNLHTTMVSTEDEVALGIVEQACWGRDPEEYGQRALRSKKPIEEKESYRWIESFRAAQQALPDDSTGIFLADRGADIYELFLEQRTENMQLIVRLLHNREIEDSTKRIFEELQNTAIIGTIDVIIKRSGERKERTATLSIRHKKISILPPKHKKHLQPISLTVVYAQEIITNKETQDPVSWKLLTTLSIDSLDDAHYVVSTYAKRWLIERYHYVLKQGCQVEELQLEDANRIDKAIAVYTIIAYRIMYMTYLARSNPELPCTHVFDEDEWRALYCYANKTAQEPPGPMSIGEAVRMLAKIGGFLGRKGDGNPGVKVVWRGMQKLEGATDMYRVLKGKKRCG